MKAQSAEKIIAQKTYADGDGIVVTVDNKKEIRIYTISAKPDPRFTDSEGWQYQESMSEAEFQTWRKQCGI